MPWSSRWFALLGVVALLAGCAPAAPAMPTPFNIVVQVLDTATPPPSATALATATGTPTGTATRTVTPIPPTLTPTDSEVRTKTPDPKATRPPTSTSVPSDTPTPTPVRTRAPQATRPPTATKSGATAAIGPAPDTSAYGVTGTFTLEGRSRTFKSGQKIWFRLVVTNLTESELKYGYLGVVVSNGSYHTSWSGSSIKSLGKLQWRDWVSVAEPGDYTLTLAMCLSPQDECSSAGSTWVNLSAAVPITISP